MRNREEFKSLVYEKRDRLLYEELEKKKKLNKRNKIFAVLSSAMAAVIIMAVVIPNVATWMNTGNAPVADDIPGNAPENGGDEGNGGFDKDNIVGAPEVSPAESKVEDEYFEPMATEVEGVQEAIPAETEVDCPMPEETREEVDISESDPPKDVEITPEALSPIQVKFTATLSTYYAGYSYTNDGVVGELVDDEKLGDLTMMITDYETLKTTFERLCKSTYAAAVFGGNEIFDEDRVVIVIERTGGDPSYNEVAYTCYGVEDGTLCLGREYIRNGDSEVPCIEVRCVDFVVLNKYGYDMSTIENIVISE